MLYKHGRADASTWELIYEKSAFIQSLCAFFAAVEGEIEIPPALEREFVSEVTTELIQYIQEPEFIEEAKNRSIAKGRKTPWDYVSGGTMQSLVQAYYSRSQPMTEIACIPHSPMELLQFLYRAREGLACYGRARHSTIDPTCEQHSQIEKGEQEDRLGKAAAGQSMPSVTARGKSKEKKRPNLLMHSPTHAFVLRLDLLPEKAEKKAEENMLAVKKWKCNEESKNTSVIPSARSYPLQKGRFFSIASGSSKQRNRQSSSASASLKPSNQNDPIPQFSSIPTFTSTRSSCPGKRSKTL